MSHFTWNRTLLITIIRNQIFVRRLFFTLTFLLLCMTINTNNCSNAFEHNRTTSRYQSVRRVSNNNNNNYNYNDNDSSSYESSSMSYYELLQFPIDTTTTNGAATPSEDEDEDKSYPVVVPPSMPPCRVVVFSPIWIVVAPELCGIRRPNDATISHFTTIIEYQKLFYPVAVMVSPRRRRRRLVDNQQQNNNNYNNNNNTKINQNNNCSIDEMVSNIEQINMVKNGHNEIMYLILPNGYRNRNDSNTITQQANMLNETPHHHYYYYNKYTSICTMFLSDDNIIEIENKIQQWYYQHMDTPLWQFVMMLSIDTNNDGKINRDDFNTYYDIPDNNNNNHNNHSSIKTMANIKMWILLSLLLFCIVLCWLGGRKNHTPRDDDDDDSNNGNASQQQQQSQPDDLYRQSQTTTLQNNNVVPTVGTGQYRWNVHYNYNNNNNSNKGGLTEDDFAALPRITYRTELSSSQLQLPATNVDTLEGNNTMVTTTLPIIVTKTNCIARTTDNMVHNEEVQDVMLEDNSTTAKTIRVGTQDDNNNDSSTTHLRDCCCICLEEFNDEEIVTALPRCLHLFHTYCIGEWLLVRQSDTCPLCKTTILPIISFVDDGYE